MSEDLLEQIVFEAVRNKYEFPEKDMRRLIRDELVTTNDTSTKSMSSNLAFDIHHQVKTLKKLVNPLAGDNQLRTSKRPIADLHAYSTGASEVAEYRTLEYVADFGSNPPTPPNEIDARMVELERWTSLMANVNDQLSKETQAQVLAEIYSAIIRIHPFDDGNGRAARFALIFLLSCWRQPPILIPKVRNDKRWKEALASGIAGDTVKIASILLDKMERSIGERRPDKLG